MEQPASLELRHSEGEVLIGGLAATAATRLVRVRERLANRGGVTSVASLRHAWLSLRR